VYTSTERAFNLRLLFIIYQQLSLFHESARNFRENRKLVVSGLRKKRFVAGLIIAFLFMFFGFSSFLKPARVFRLKPRRIQAL